MDQIIALLVLIGFAVLVMPIIALVLASKATGDSKEAKRKLATVESELQDLKRQLESRNATSPTERNPAPPPPTPPALPTPGPQPATPEKPPAPPQQTPALKQPQPVVPQMEPTPPTQAKAPPTQAKVPPTQANFSLEQFMGVKLFAWLGGIAMFFGVIFFVKYAFDHNLIPPSVRVALGFITGVALLVGGLWTHRRKPYRILAQSLCATGILVLYGVSFAAHAVYQFPAFSQPVTFSLMCLVTLAAFLIAVRLNAQVVAALGMVGGFLSPILLPLVQDSPFALFSYIALLDIGVLATTRYRPWKYLPIATVSGTALILLLWHNHSFVSGDYFAGNRTLIPMGILLFFSLLFGAAAWDQKRRKISDLITTGSALAMSSIAMVFAFVFLQYEQICHRPFLLYGFILTLNLVPLAIARFEPRWHRTRPITGLITFLHLTIWTIGYLDEKTLNSALLLYLLFGTVHAAHPIILDRLRKHAPPPSQPSGNSWFLPLSLLLITLAVGMQKDATPAVWVVVLLADLITIALAVFYGAILVLIGAIVVTLLIAATWLLQAPPSTDLIAPLMGITVFFGGLFTAVGIWLNQRNPRANPNEINPTAAAPILSSALPFGLLSLATLQLPLGNPSPIFGVGLLFSILLLGLMIIGRQPPLALLAMLCMFAVEWTWHISHFNPQHPWMAFGWYLGFYVLFTAFPLIFRKACEQSIAPWTACALTGVGHFLLIHHLVNQSFTTTMGHTMGAVPLAFAIPSLIALFVVIKRSRDLNAISRSQLAWLGGVSLFFITLIFPIQFDRQWLTVSWALEGAALIWLFTRVPHVGLKWTGIALLTTAFIRLALNPAVISEYPRSGTAILNWHLYAYGLAAAALVIGAKLLPTAHRKYGEIPLSGTLYAFGGILLFLLLNIQIADFFTEPGKRFITLEFGNHFARDMTYSIAWGLFSLGLLVIGIRWRNPAPRYAAIGLLVITLLKVFLHDLAAIENIFRIGALIGVAITAFIASFLYQRFYSQSDDSTS